MAINPSNRDCQLSDDGLLLRDADFIKWESNCAKAQYIGNFDSSEFGLADGAGCALRGDTAIR